MCLKSWSTWLKWEKKKLTIKFSFYKKSKYVSVDTRFSFSWISIAFLLFLRAVRDIVSSIVRCHAGFWPSILAWISYICFTKQISSHWFVEISSIGCSPSYWATRGKVILTTIVVSISNHVYSCISHTRCQFVKVKKCWGGDWGYRFIAWWVLVLALAK